MKITVLHAHIQLIVTDMLKSIGKGKNKKPKLPRGSPGKMATFPLMMASQTTKKRGETP